MAARRPTYERKALAFSIVLHTAIFALGWVSTLYEPEAFEFVTYEIELVSPAPPEQADVARIAAEELVVELPETQPEPEPEPEVTPPPPPERDPEPDPEPTPEPEPEPDPEPTPPTPPADERQPPPEEEPRPATTTEAPPEDVAETGEGINVRLEGVRRDYPAYYDNIIRQIQRCFRWQGGGDWETTVYFAIQPDGTATDIEFVSRSGNTSFDFEAMGAIDCAGHGRFGALPEDLPFDRLPVQFSFRPMGMER
jgi:outer membrane biosynthesis protein TonB